MVYKFIFAILNIIGILFIPVKIYFLVGLIAAAGVIYLDFPRAKNIFKKVGSEDFPMGLYIFFQIGIDTCVWIYSLLNFTQLVFSGKWEQQLNEK